MTKVINDNRAIDSFYLHYKDQYGEDVYELIKLDEHASVELDLEWEGFNTLEQGNPSPSQN